MDRKCLIALGGSLVLGLAGLVHADATTSETDALRSKVATLESRLAEVEAKENGNWLNARRAEEVKGLVREVLADADTRASLMDNAMTAGYNGSHFFLGSEDGSFLLNISGQLDFRYMVNIRQNVQNTDGNNDVSNGFEMTRAKLTFDGHVASPKIGYMIRLAIDHGDNVLYADTIMLSYQLNDQIQLYGGELTAPFLHEEILDSSTQLAAERSLVGQIFTQGYVQGIGVAWDATDALKINAMITDGSRSGQAGRANLNGINPVYLPNDVVGFQYYKYFDSDQADFAAVARADYKVMGDWAQNDDYTSWSGSPNALFVGAAVAYEAGRTGNSPPNRADSNNNKSFAWTVDATAKMQGFAFSIAGMGQHLFLDDDLATAAGTAQIDLYGLVAQGSYNINDKIEPFARFEYLDYNELENTGALGSASNDDLMLVTVGVNLYQRKHNAKFTADVVWALNDIPAPILNLSNSGGTGLIADPAADSNQVVFRLQYQLLF